MCTNVIGRYVLDVHINLLAEDNKMALFWAIKHMLILLWHRGQDDFRYQCTSIAVRQLRAAVESCSKVPGSVKEFYSADAETVDLMSKYEYRPDITDSIRDGAEMETYFMPHPPV